MALSHGFLGVGLWREVLEGEDLDRLRRRVRAEGIAVTSVCRGGMFTHPDPSRSEGIQDGNLAVDAYHVWWDYRLHADLEAAAGLMASVQVADWISPINDELDSRAMPGEGCIDLTEFIARARQAGYRGLVEIEVLSRRWWAQPPQTVAAAAAAAIAHL